MIGGVQLSSEVCKYQLPNLIEENNNYRNLYNKYKDLPNNIRSLIISIKYNYYLKNNIKRLVKERKNSNSNIKGPKILIRDNTTR